jgi:hypothetical protein
MTVFNCKRGKTTTTCDTLKNRKREKKENEAK